MPESSLIVDPDSLAAFCDRHRDAAFLAVDTEFMRERTYYPKLCLVQVAAPQEAVAIDPLAPGLSLQPLLDLLSDPAIVKVFHAARQDVEILYTLSGRMPAPLFDTQVAAMVCGYGEQVSYETLAGRLAGAKIDKSSRFTDWSLRPLDPRQIRYALDDVTHLRVVYDKLVKRLHKTGRASWVAEEMASLIDPALYRNEPEESWRRLKPRTGSGRFLAVLREVCAWREREAQRRDLPRQRLVRDEALLEIAAHEPGSVEALARVRSLGRSFAEGPMGQALLEAVARGIAVPKEQQPAPLERGEPPAGRGPILELLRVLLKLKCEEHDVAQKLVASAADLDLIAADDRADVPALQGWRRTVFGEDALALKSGRLALTAKGSRIEVVEIE